MELNFFKYQGTGNDFVIIDAFENNIALKTEQIQKICNRRFGIGADGLMLFLPHDTYDFEMKYYNADGKESTMCGNGGRCLSAFAQQYKFNSKYAFTFWAIDGAHQSTIELNNVVKLKMQDVDSVKKYVSYFVLNTGSPHCVKFVNNLTDYKVKEEGATIRNNEYFVQEGINVNFVEQQDNGNNLFVRTYERGVEDETLSCGTGVTASALVSAHNDNGFNYVSVQTLGGKLWVEFENHNNESFTNIWLCGVAKFVFKGSMEL